jgi:hypothetical protein
MIEHPHKFAAGTVLLVGGRGVPASSAVGGQLGTFHDVRPGERALQFMRMSSNYRQER